MFDSLTPPTDNLYKFIAIAGLKTALFFGWSRVQTDIEVRKLNRNVSGGTAAHVKMQAALFASGFEKLASDVENGTVIDAKNAMERIDGIVDSTSPEIEEHYKQLINDVWNLGVYQRDHSPERTVYLYAALVGVLIAICGFWLWWQRVQKFSDELLRLQLAKARIESNTTSQRHA